MAYDPKCYDLAVAFLEDYDEVLPGAQLKRERHALAQTIQDTIEGFLSLLEGSLLDCDEENQP